MRVLLAEPDATLACRLNALFSKAGIVVETADTGEDAIDLAQHYDFDLVLLALALPDMDGFDALRRLRARGVNTPVMALARDSRPETRVRALGLGADDVVAKPFDTDELMARVQAIIRRSKGHSQAVLQVGTVQLNLDSREVFVSGTPVHVTAKEYAILQLLILRKGLALSKEAFLNHLYGGMDEPEAKIIDVFVCKLRRKLAQAGAPDLISTVWGRGYMVRDAQTRANAPRTPVSGGVPVMPREAVA